MAGINEEINELNANLQMGTVTGNKYLEINKDTGQPTLKSGGSSIDMMGKGWAVYQDDTYTSGSPLVIASTQSQLTCDGAGSGTNKSYLPDGVSDFWNTTTNKITPENIGDCYDLRVQFKAKCSTVSAYFDFELDIGGALGIITARTLSSSKGANTEQRYSVGLPVFSLSTFVANGGTIYLNSTDDGTTVSVYDIQILIKRDYKAP